MFTTFTERYASISIEGALEWTAARKFFGTRLIDITAQTDSFLRKIGLSPYGNLATGGTFLLRHDQPRQGPHNYVFVWSDLSRGSGVFAPHSGGTFNRLQVARTGLESVNKVRVITAGLTPITEDKSISLRVLSSLFDPSGEVKRWPLPLQGLSFLSTG